MWFRGEDQTDPREVTRKRKAVLGNAFLTISVAKGAESSYCPAVDKAAAVPLGEVVLLLEGRKEPEQCFQQYKDETHCFVE